MLATIFISQYFSLQFLHVAYIYDFAEEDNDDSMRAGTGGHHW